MPDNEFQTLATELKESIQDVAKKLHATLDEERKTFEKIVEGKAEGKAVSDLQEKLARLEEAHDKAKAQYDEELTNLKMSMGSGGSPEGKEEEMKSAFFEVLRSGNNSGLSDRAKGDLLELLTKSYNDWSDQPKSKEQIKSMLSGIDTTGGVLVMPAFLENSVYKFLDENVALYGLAGRTSISSPEYRRDARLSEAGAVWEGESDPWPATKTPDYGSVEIKVNKLIAMPSISRDLLEDARINMEAEIMDFTRDAFSKAMAYALIHGSGVRQPHGILEYPTIPQSKAENTWGKIGYAVTTDASGFKNDETRADCLIEMQSILKAAYGDRAGWLMNRKTGTTIRKFKNSDGDYLWQPSLTAGQPANLLGSPVYYDANMPDVAANKFPIAYGDFNSALLIVNRRGMTVIRDLTSRPGHVKYLIDMRLGAGIRNFDAIKLLKVAAS